MNADRPSGFSLRTRPLYIAGGGIALGLLFAGTLASGAWNEPSIPVGDLVAQDALLSGVVHMKGADFTVYSGARIRALNSSVDMNLQRGGTIQLCPRSEVQVIRSSEHAPVLLAFQSGGAVVPFEMRPGDVAMTPDWRIEFQGPEASRGQLSMSMNENGGLCFHSDAPQESHFHISQLSGTADFNMEGSGEAHFLNGVFRKDPSPCSCETAPVSASSPPVTTVAEEAPPSSGAQPTEVQKPAPVNTVAEPAPIQPVVPLKVKVRRHPQDVVGYVGSAIHFLFGR